MLLSELSALPPKPTGRVDWPGYLGNLVKSLQQRVELIPLLRAFAAAKRAEGAVDFADQMVLATQLARLDSVAEIERSRYKVVLLDEYQDTGHAQIEMLAALFADGRSVTAVGDPLQSIYGWRGASANSIRRFDGLFRQSSGEAAQVYPLMTSWRNDRRILRAANRVAEDLRQPAELPCRHARARRQVRWRHRWPRPRPTRRAGLPGGCAWNGTAQPRTGPQPDGHWPSSFAQAFDYPRCATGVERTPGFRSRLSTSEV